MIFLRRCDRGRSRLPKFLVEYVPEMVPARYAFRNMAELKIAPARDSSNLGALLLAVVVLAAAAAAIFYFNPHRVADFKVVAVEPYAPQTTFGRMDGATGNGTHVLDAPTSSTEDDLYVIAKVSITDKLRLPLYITGATARVTFADGTTAEANLLSAIDYKRLEVIFPAIAEHAPAAPITDGDVVAPGQTRVGTLLLPFPGRTADAWQSKSKAVLTLELRNQKPLTAVLP